MKYRVDILGKNMAYADRLKQLNRQSWPEFLLYGDTPSWESIYDALADGALLLIDSNEVLVAAGLTIAVTWSGRTDDLPGSIESIIRNGLASIDRSPNTLMAVAALVDRRYRGQHLSAEILKQMRLLARHRGLRDLLVPVRPTWKARYPLQRMESYANWRRADGLYYDPWLRTHERLGAKLVACADHTYTVEGSIEDWQRWTGLIFPESGSYTVEGALQPIEIDVASDTGIYHDPNVWMRHSV